MEKSPSSMIQFPEAIVKMEAPWNLTELRRFMGMVNQLGKFSTTYLRSVSHFEIS